MDFTLYTHVDILTAGAPCQPFSNGGLHGGERDPRNLWMHVVRAVRECAPRIFFFEMVDGFLNSSHDRLREKVQSALAEEGYIVKIKKTDARDHGLAQRRKRCVLLGYHETDASSHGDLPHLEPLPLTSIREAFRDLPPLGSTARPPLGSQAAPTQASRRSTCARRASR